MAARFKLPTEVLKAKYGKLELFRDSPVAYKGDTVAMIKAGDRCESIYCEIRHCIVGADIMTINQLIASGLAQRISIYTLSNDGDSYCWHWVRDGLVDTLEGTYSDARML